MNPILCQDNGGIRTITLNRVEKRNALSLQMYQALTKYLIQTINDDDIKVVIIQGQSGCFTSGNDISDFISNTTLNNRHPVVQFLNSLIHCNKPIIAAVEGVAVGIGTTMLLHCDLVYAHQSAKLQLPFVNLALVPEAASSLLLPRLVGHQIASELLLFGDPFDANRALQLGLINSVVTDDVYEFANQKARLLAQKPLTSLVASKKLMKSHSIEQIKMTMQAEFTDFARQLASPEAQQIFQSFLAK